MTTLLMTVILGCALVAVSKGQDMTSLMFQAMGMEPPILPPTMPRSLREHLYPRKSAAAQQQLQQHHQLLLLRQQQQKQRLMAYLASRQNPNKANPYSLSYSSSLGNAGVRENSLYSPANTIHRPGTANALTSNKGNPYSFHYSGRLGNPYSISGAAASNVPSIRNQARLSTVSRPTSGPVIKDLRTLRALSTQPKKIKDAKMAGCKLPVESAAASALLFKSCRHRAAQMLCQTQVMSCVDVGMTPMCCPFGMNRLAMDTISYVNKLQHYVSEVA